VPIGAFNGVARARKEGEGTPFIKKKIRASAFAIAKAFFRQECGRFFYFGRAFILGGAGVFVLFFLI
jgi:hypothetical protein